MSESASMEPEDDSGNSGNSGNSDDSDGLRLLFGPQNARDVARLEFEYLEEAQTDLRRAEARRVRWALLAWDASMHDAKQRYGSGVAWRGGDAGRAFIVDLADVLNLPRRSAAHLLDTALRLRDHLPKTMAEFDGGNTTWRAVELAVQQSEGLDESSLPDYDERAADLVVTANPSRLKEKLHRMRERLHADSAAERHRLAEAERHVEVEPLPDGMAALHLYGPAPEIVAIYKTLTAGAVGARGAEGEDRSLGNLRFDIAADLLLEGGKTAANEHQAASVRVKARKGISPTVFVTVPVMTLLGGSEPADLDGYGPVDPDTARRLTGQASSLFRILTHPVTGTRMTFDRSTYKVPPDLRRYLQLRDGTCQEPGCRRPADECDLDHTIAWDDGGPTNDDNLAALCRPGHLMKHDGLWDVEREQNGDLVWTSPWGRRHYSEPADWVTHQRPTRPPEPPQPVDHPADDPVPWN